MTSLAQVLIDKWEGNTPSLRDDYKSKLEHGVWIVEFTKTDGTPSVMECTLDSKYLPAKVEQSTKRPEQPHLIHVYSLDRNGWRSFIINNVTKFYKKPDIL